MVLKYLDFWLLDANFDSTIVANLYITIVTYLKRHVLHYEVHYIHRSSDKIESYAVVLK